MSACCMEGGIASLTAAAGWASNVFGSVHAAAAACCLRRVSHAGVLMHVSLPPPRAGCLAVRGVPAGAQSVLERLLQQLGAVQGLLREANANQGEVFRLQDYLGDRPGLP